MITVSVSSCNDIPLTFCKVTDSKVRGGLVSVELVDDDTRVIEDKKAKLAFVGCPQLEQNAGWLQYSVAMSDSLVQTRN